MPAHTRSAVHLAATPRVPVGVCVPGYGPDRPQLAFGELVILAVWAIFAPRTRCPPSPWYVGGRRAAWGLSARAGGRAACTRALRQSNSELVILAVGPMLAVARRAHDQHGLREGAWAPCTLSHARHGPSRPPRDGPTTLTGTVQEPKSRNQKSAVVTHLRILLRFQRPGRQGNRMVGAQNR
jgi:hypothetical protein